MEEKAFGGIMILSILFLHYCTIRHSAAAFPLSASSGDSAVPVKHNRKLLDMGEVNDYDSPGPNRRHDPPTSTLVPTPAPTSTPSTADDNAKPGPNTRHGHGPPTP